MQELIHLQHEGNQAAKPFFWAGLQLCTTRACSTETSQQPTFLHVAPLQRCATKSCQCLHAAALVQQAALAASTRSPAGCESHGVVCVEEPAKPQLQSACKEASMQP